MTQLSLSLSLSLSCVCVKVVVFQSISIVKPYLAASHSPISWSFPLDQPHHEGLDCGSLADAIGTDFLGVALGAHFARTPCTPFRLTVIIATSLARTQGVFYTRRAEGLKTTNVAKFRAVLTHRTIAVITPNPFVIDRSSTTVAFGGVNVGHGQTHKHVTKEKQEKACGQEFAYHKSHRTLFYCTSS